MPVPAPDAPEPVTAIAFPATTALAMTGEADGEYFVVFSTRLEPKPRDGYNPARAAAEMTPANWRKEALRDHMEGIWAGFYPPV